MGLSPLFFTGVSRFSEDLQTILQRSVAIASLPIKQMQNEQVVLWTKKQLVTDLGSSVNAFKANLEALGTLGQNKALSVTSSNANRVAVTLTGSASPSVYTISNITSVARAASETSLTGYASATGVEVAAGGQVELVFGSNTYTLNLAEGQNHLNGLRDAINALGIGVNASVINTGSAEDPYHLAVTASATGATTLALRTVPAEPGSNMLTASNQGANAVFQLNGLTITKPDNVIRDVISGVAFTILGATAEGETVTINAASSRALVAGALETFVAGYNSLSGKLKAQIGESAGLLSGDVLVRQVRTALQAVHGYRGTGSVASLAEVGIEVDRNGVMSFNQEKFYALSTAQLQSVFELLGSATTGIGGLAARFNQITDPSTGLVKSQQDYYDTADRRLSQQIAALNSRVDLMRSGLMRRLQETDTLLAGLESQQGLLEGTVKSLYLALYGKGKSE